MRGPTDSELIRAILAGKRDLFLQLVQRYGPMVTAVAQHYLQDEASAERVAVATFRKAFQDLRRIGDPDRLYERLLQEAREAAMAAGGAVRPAKEGPAEVDRSLASIVRWKYLEGLDYAQIAERLRTSPETVDRCLLRGRSWNRLQRAGAEAQA